MATVSASKAPGVANTPPLTAPTVTHVQQRFVRRARRSRLEQSPVRRADLAGGAAHRPPDRDRVRRSRRRARSLLATSAGTVKFNCTVVLIGNVRPPSRRSFPMCLGTSYPANKLRF
jgi:hypothetical protein